MLGRLDISCARESVKTDKSFLGTKAQGLVHIIYNDYGHLVTKNPKKVLSLGVGLTGFAIIGLFLITVEVQYNKMFR